MGDGSIIGRSWPCTLICFLGARRKSRLRLTIFFLLVSHRIKPTPPPPQPVTKKQHRSDPTRVVWHLFAVKVRETGEGKDRDKRSANTWQHHQYTTWLKIAHIFLTRYSRLSGSWTCARTAWSVCVCGIRYKVKGPGCLLWHSETQRGQGERDKEGKLQV
jgi:hypothetical protein